MCTTRGPSSSPPHPPSPCARRHCLDVRRFVGAYASSALCDNAGCESGSHEKRLLHALLDNYNVLERPVVNESDPLQLSFGLTLMQIIDVVSNRIKRIDS